MLLSKLYKPVMRPYVQREREKIGALLRFELNKAEINYNNICNILEKASRNLQLGHFEKLIILNGALTIAERFELSKETILKYRRQVVHIEKEYFLDSNLPLDEEYIDEDFVKTKDCKQQLNNYREWVKSEWFKIENQREGNGYHLDYADKIDELYAKIENFLKGFLTDLIEEVIDSMGNYPGRLDGRLFDFLSLGSLSNVSATPYSDIEAMVAYVDDILPSKDEEAQRYFLQVGHLLFFQIMRLGETAIPFSLIACDLDALIKPALQPDLGGKAIIDRKDDPTYRLRGRVRDIASYITRESINSAGKIEILPTILLSARNLVRSGSSNQILSLYNRKIEEVLNRRVLGRADLDRDQNILLAHSREDEVFLNQRAKELLKYAFDHHAPKISGDNIFNVKQDLYRFPDRIINALALHAGIIGGQSGFDRLLQLEEVGFITSAQREQLSIAYALTLSFRLGKYLEAGCQCDDMEVIDSLTEKEEVDKLFALYSRTIPLYRELERLIKGGINCLAESETDFLEENSKNQGLVYRKLGKYQEAIECFSDYLPMVKNDREKSEIYCILSEMKFEMLQIDEAFSDLYAAQNALSHELDKLELARLKIFEAEAKVNYLKIDGKENIVILLEAWSMLDELVDPKELFADMKNKLKLRLEEILNQYNLPLKKESLRSEVRLQEDIARVDEGQLDDDDFCLDLNTAPDPVAHFSGRANFLQDLSENLRVGGGTIIGQVISGAGVLVKPN